MNTAVKTYVCPECGDVPLNHRLEKAPKVLEMYLRRFFLTRMLFDSIDPPLSRLCVSIASTNTFVSFLNFLVGIRALTATENGHGQTNTRVLALFEGARARNVMLRQYALAGVAICFVAEKKVGTKLERVTFRIIPRPRGFVSPSLPWMDNKGTLKKKMEEAHIPHADGGVARTFAEAVAIFKRLGTAVIVKPHEGSRGRHTTLNIETEEELRRGFDIALQITTHAVVEKYLHGVVHRVTLVGGKPAAVARRQYPHVFGDGVHTVDELIDIENQNPLRHGAHFRPLDKEYRVAEALRHQQLTHESIPASGQLVILGDKNSRLHGTVTEDVTDTVHPDNIELFERFAQVLGDPIVGVDFMIEDMSKSWKEQPDAGVIECNSMPFIDVHHQVVSGRPINVAAYLWDVIFPEHA